MGEDLIKVVPEEGRLSRQSNESYILVNVCFDLELRHFKAMLILSSVGGMDLTIPQNAMAATKALEKAADLLSMTVVDWHWLDREGIPYEIKPKNNPDAFDPLSMDEINWMLEAVSTLLREDATPGGT